MKQLPRKLNLGSGQFYKAGYLNIDIDRNAKCDLRWDLNNSPYPFRGGAFSVIEADHVLEHLRDVFKTMREFHRLLEPGGVLKIKVPHFSRGMTHADHKRCFDLSFPYYFKKSFQGGYAGVPFELLQQKFVWWGLRRLKSTILPLPVRILGWLFGFPCDLLANFCPALCSRIWCFWVGGFEELHFTFRKPISKRVNDRFGKNLTGSKKI